MFRPLGKGMFGRDPEIHSKPKETLIYMLLLISALQDFPLGVKGKIVPAPGVPGSWGKNVWQGPQNNGKARKPLGLHAFLVSAPPDFPPGKRENVAAPGEIMYTRSMALNIK